MKNRLAIIIAIAIVILDQITKFFFSNIEKSIPVIKNIFHFTLVHNRGAGFGILQGQRWFFIIFSLIVLGGIAYKWKKIPENINITVPLGLLIGGIIGNLYDRIAYGFVIDFIDFRIWPVFNIADSAITVAAVWLTIYLWKK